MIFVDSNIPMYLIGAAHPHKAEAQVLLERLIASGQRLVTDAEVLQEILHRYAAIEKREAIGPALQVTLDIVDEVFPIVSVKPTPSSPEHGGVIDWRDGRATESVGGEAPQELGGGRGVGSRLRGERPESAAVLREPPPVSVDTITVSETVTGIGWWGRRSQMGGGGSIA
ncbi:MAG: type II toxin-antitoxin system VapC family toxin [Bryobacteraceae bacterium]|nr:type II toxin-antitoxin system VapC family toxin [Bryobacteraceae bacterium]